MHCCGTTSRHEGRLVRALTRNGDSLRRRHGNHRTTSSKARSAEVRIDDIHRHFPEVPLENGRMPAPGGATCSQMHGQPYTRISEHAHCASCARQGTIGDTPMPSPRLLHGSNLATIMTFRSSLRRPAQLFLSTLCASAIVAGGNSPNERVESPQQRRQHGNNTSDHTLYDQPAPRNAQSS
jgi:hypothetical protein